MDYQCRDLCIATHGCDSTPDVCNMNRSSCCSGEHHDPVNHPKHYNSHPSGIECITITRRLSFNMGNAFKYLFRHGKKGERLEDLKKALWYLNDEIASFSRLQSGHVSEDMAVVASFEKNLNIEGAYRAMSMAADFNHKIICLKLARDYVEKEIANVENQ